MTTEPFELMIPEEGRARFEAAYAQAGKALEAFLRATYPLRDSDAKGKVLLLRVLDEGITCADRFACVGDALRHASVDVTHRNWKKPLEIWDFGNRCVYDCPFILRYITWAVGDEARQKQEQVARLLAEEEGKR